MQPDDPGEGQQIHHHYHGDAQRHSFGRLIDTILPAAIIGLVGVVWMLSNSVTRLTEQVSALTQMQNTQFANLRAEVAAVKADVREPRR